MSQTDPDYDVPCDQACDSYKTALVAYDELERLAIDAVAVIEDLMKSTGGVLGCQDWGKLNDVLIRQRSLFASTPEPDPMMPVCMDVLAEIKGAREKHGRNFISELDDVVASEDPMALRAEQLMCGYIGQAGYIARTLCDNGHASRLAVLVEEVDEVRQALVEATDPVPELVQVAAMAIAWAEVAS